MLFGADGAQGNPSNLYRLDPATGAVLQNVGPIGFPITGLAEDPSTGTLYGSTARGPSTSTEHNGLLIRIDEQTGAGRLIGDLRPDPDDETAADITFTPDGALFGWLEPNSDDLAAINKATGLASIVATPVLAPKEQASHPTRRGLCSSQRAMPVRSGRSIAPPARPPRWRP